MNTENWPIWIFPIIWLAMAILAVAYTSFGERFLHKELMHKKAKIFGFVFEYPFIAHTLVHHQKFRADESYCLDTHEHPEADAATIPMKWWNGPAIVFMTTATFPLDVALITGMWSFVYIFAAVGLAYYGLYEWSHWCMHKPLAYKKRFIERYPFRGKIFLYLNKHHNLHHLHMHKHFNVVCPLADLVLGTYIPESKRTPPVATAQTSNRA
ncbi:MAG: Fatty acid hydroxylase superfamily [Candidatus Taylorbacteria bacterium]|nr:Fatty acid hydroxylase superfamily [Candidatus Taylorbacteria bacterium]